MKFALIALCCGLMGSAFAVETWHVTAGNEHATWTLNRTRDGLQGQGEVTKPDGTIGSAIVEGDNTQIISADSASIYTCIYEISQQTATTVSGLRTCDEEEMPWSATIDNPTDMTPPTLLAEHQDPHDSAAYKTLAAGARSKVDAEVKEFDRDMAVLSSFIGIRDAGCLDNQYLNIRLQKPDWTQQDIQLFIQFTCIVPDLVHSQALSVCKGFKELWPHDLGNDPRFCPCYADYYTDHFIAEPNNSSQGQAQIGADAANECD